MSKKIVFTFGRFNPPTSGHFLLATKVKQEASRRGADHIIYGSSSQDAARNPLNPRQKLRFMKKVLRGFNVDINRSIANPYDVLEKLNKEGYDDVVMVVGADRVNEFRRGMKRYIGPNKLYKFKNFEVVSAGERDPDADDVTGMSASKMRAVAKEGNIAAFKLGVPSHVSTNDVSAFFKAVQTGMKIKPFIEESWFDYDEFMEFLEEEKGSCVAKNMLKKFDMSGEGIDIPAVNNRVWGTEGIKKSAKKKKVKVEEETELNELTIQARRKMAMSAKRTAKRRARKRKMKEKRKKSGTEIKKKAQKSAISKIRNKMIKGVNWNDLSYSQREKIGERLKKKKGAIQKLAKRLLPATQKAEQERLKKVRARMTTNDPAKAVEKFENVDYDFEMEVLSESARMQKAEQVRIAKQRERDRGTGAETPQERNTAEKKAERKVQGSGKLTWKDVAIVKNTASGNISFIKSPNPARHDPVTGGEKGKASIEVGRKAAKGKFGTFKPNKYSRELLGTSVGGEDEETTNGASSDEQGTNGVQGFAQRNGDVEVPLTDAQKRTQTNVDKAEEFRSKTDAGMAQDEWDQYQQGKEVELDQVTMQNYATDMGQKMGIAAKPPTAKQAKKLVSTKDGQFEDWHAAVDVESAMVAVGNGCHLKETGEEMKKCLSDSDISDGDIKKLAQSPTLIPAAMRLWDRVGMQLPEGMVWQHTGKGLGEVALSPTYDTAGAKNKTPKTDLRACDPKTGKCMNLSMKMGKGQLMSGQAGESIGTFRVVLDRMRGCKGRTIDSDGKMNGVACTRKLGKGDKELIKDMEQVIKDIEDVFIKTKVSEGMGPIGWWLGKGIGGQKPSWWYRTGPGRPGMDISWEDAQGKDPNDHPEWFIEDRKELEKNMAIIQKADKAMDDIQDKLGRIYGKGKFGQEMKEHVMYEAMTGCGKFCDGCCGVDICKECQSIHAATHIIVGNKDGTGGMIKEIEPPGSKMLREMSVNTTVDVRFKTTSGVKSAQGWFKEMEPGIFEKIKFQTKAEQKAGVKQKKLTAPEHERLLELIGYTGQTLPKGKTHWDKLTKKQQLKILRKAEVKLGTYNINSVHGMGSEFKGGGVGKIFDEVQPKFRTFLEHSGDKENGGEYGLKDAMDWVGHDPGRLAEFLGLEPTIDANHESYGDVFEPEETSGKSNTVTIDGKTKTIPIAKDDEYRDYQAEREEGQEDMTPEQFRQDNVNENTNKKNVRRKLQTFAIHESGRADNERVSYEFKDSSTHGLGSFSTREINENEQVALYYLNLLNENENAPQYQRTDFCRFTNHSQHIPNVVLEENEDGNFYTYATRDIQEGEEILIDYFLVFESILPAIKEEGEVIPEVLRWTAGYDGLEIPPDDFGDLRDELQYFAEINEAVDIVTGELDETSLAKMSQALGARQMRNHIATQKRRAIVATRNEPKVKVGKYDTSNILVFKGRGRAKPKVNYSKKELEKTEKRIVARMRKLGADKIRVTPTETGGEIREPKSPHILQFARAHMAAGAKREAKKQGLGEGLRNIVRDKIDDFKFYHSPLQTKIRKEKKEKKKRGKKYNKMVGIKSEEVQLDKDTELEESYNEKGLLKKGLTHAIYSKGPSGQIHFTHRRKKFADFKAKMYTDAIQFNQKDHPGFGVMIVPHGTPNGKSVHKDHEKYYGKADESVELEERKYYRGDIVRGRRGNHADQEYVVHSGNSEENPNSMTVKIDNKKVKVSPHNFNSTGRRKYFPGPKLKEGAGDASASASETDANRAAYLKQYGAKPEQRERRSARTNARNKLIRRGRASVGDGKDLDHKDGNPLNNSPNNLRMVNKSFNRGRDNNKWRKKTNEEHGAGEIGTKKLLKRYIKDTPFMKILKNRK